MSRLREGDECGRPTRLGRLLEGVRQTNQYGLAPGTAVERDAEQWLSSSTGTLSFSLKMMLLFPPNSKTPRYISLNVSTNVVWQVAVSRAYSP